MRDIWIVKLICFRADPGFRQKTNKKTYRLLKSQGGQNVLRANAACTSIILIESTPLGGQNHTMWIHKIHNNKQLQNKWINYFKRNWRFCALHNFWNTFETFQKYFKSGAGHMARDPLFAPIRTIQIIFLFCSSISSEIISKFTADGKTVRPLFSNFQ
jgi:hypothetical protein